MKGIYKVHKNINGSCDQGNLQQMQLEEIYVFYFK